MIAIDAVVLSGGFGTRLAPVFDGPKGLVPVQGTPVVAHVIDWCLGSGADRVIVAAGYRGLELQSAVSRIYDSDVCVSIEERPLGTAGCLIRLLPGLSDPFVVVNGDTLIEGDLISLWQYHSRVGADVTVGVFRSQRRDVGEVHVLTGPPGPVVKVCPRQDSRNVWANAGVYVLAHNVLPSRERELSMEHEVLPRVSATHGLYAYPIANVYDIGTPERLRGVDEHWRGELSNRLQ